MTGPTPTLRGRRVALRPYDRGFSAGEVDRFLSWALDEEVVGLAGGSPLRASPERFRELFVQRMPLRNTDREQQFAVLDETGELIGRTGLFGIDAVSRTAELGIMIGQKERWGSGYGRDAVAALCRYAFEDLGLRRIVLYTFPDNRRAQRCFASVGFRVVRKLRRLTLEAVRSELEMDLVPARLVLSPATGSYGGQEDGPDGGHDAVAPD